MADDAVDEGDEATAPERLETWARELDAIYAGRPTTSTGVALTAALERFPIPKEAFAGLIEGCRQDLVKTRYSTFQELLGYCDLVASTISTISLSIFGGLGNPEAQRHGRYLATALQLTNIIRDVGDDLDRDRIYLPEEDLERFGVSELDLLARKPSAEFSMLMRFEAERALVYFVKAEPVKLLVDPPCRFAVTMMGGIYAEVARRVHRDPLYSLVGKVGLSRGEKVLEVAKRLFDRRFVRDAALLSWVDSRKAEF
jgi:phytoene synthase